MPDVDAWDWLVDEKPLSEIMCEKAWLGFLWESCGGHVYQGETLKSHSEQ